MICGVWWIFEVGMFGGYSMIWLVCVLLLGGVFVMFELNFVYVKVVM